MHMHVEAQKVAGVFGKGEEEKRGEMELEEQQSLGMDGVAAEGLGQAGM